MKHSPGVALAVSALALSACSTGAGDATPDNEPSNPSDTSTAVASEAADATAIAEQLKSATDTAGQVTTLTEDNDPNNLIGRPNGYRSAAVLYDNQLTCDSIGVDCGLTIEVFADPPAARKRVEFIQTTQQAATILGSEWDYVKGPILLRISGELKPSVAEKYASEFKGEEVRAVETNPSGPEAGS